MLQLEAAVQKLLGCLWLVKIPGHKKPRAWYAEYADENYSRGAE